MLQVKGNNTRPMMNKFTMRNMSRLKNKFTMKNMSRFKNKLMMRNRTLLTNLNRSIKMIYK